MDVVAELVIAPFRDIADKGREAGDNAAHNKDMATESQKLTRGAERILKTVVPLCTRLYDEYGANFIDELKQNDEIASYRTQLNTLLWDFEDEAMEPDTFEKDSYVDLQKLCKSAGLSIGEILRRMKLEPLIKVSPRALPSPPATNNPSKMTVPSLPPAGSPVKIPVKTPPTPEPQLEERGRAASPPHFSYKSPWDLQTRPPFESTPETHKDVDDTRRPAVSSDDLAAASPRMSLHAFTRHPVVTPDPVSEDNEGRDISAASPTKTGTDRARAISSDSTGGFPIAGHDGVLSATLGSPIPEHDTHPFSRDPYSTTSISPITRSRTHRDSHASLHSTQSEASHRQSHRSIQDSTIDAGCRDDHTDRPTTTTFAPDRPEDITGAGTFVADDGYHPMTRTSTFASQCESGLELVKREPDPKEEKILANDGSEIDPSRPSQVALRPRDCNIGVTSSFCIYRGFCEGAKETARGGNGFKKTRKPGFTSTYVISKCTSCDYELPQQSIDLDVSKRDEGTTVNSGIRHRIRFLQKSHIATKRSDENLYGCVFCIHSRETLEECDATVFFSSKKLFEHLARHPRPLVQVPGVTVVETPEVPPELHNNYDLHLRRRQVASPMDESRDRIDRAPTATAAKTVRRMYGTLRMPPDLETPTFELAEGARIVGIEFPAQYHGEWAMGWHDGAVKAVPLDVIRLDPPLAREVRMGGTSNVSAVAKWRFALRTRDGGGSEWLRFDKGEVITNISWAHTDHWCWSGTNAKGRWGMFPQTFIDTNTVHEQVASDRASVHSNERGGGGGSSVREIFTLRKKRPPSYFGPLGSAAGAGRMIS